MDAVRKLYVIGDERASKTPLRYLGLPSRPRVGRRKRKSVGTQHHHHVSVMYCRRPVRQKPPLAPADRHGHLTSRQDSRHKRRVADELGHGPRGGTIIQLIGSADLKQPSLANYGDPVGNGECILLIVRDKQRRDA